MKHKIISWLLVLPLCLLTLAGCGQNSSLKQASSTFFRAFNKVSSADSLDLAGDLGALGIAGDFQWKSNSDPQQAALQIDTEEGTYSFYLNEGKTYLDALGTKSSSLAENIGIDADTRLRLPNPFLDMDETERDALFDSVKIEEDTYTFQINPDKLAAFFDSYGAVYVSSASLQCEIVDGEMKTFVFDMQGTYDIDIAQADTPIHIAVDILSADDPVDITFPNDLNTWPAQ